jgi:hypothetical protein
MACNCELITILLVCDTKSLLEIVTLTKFFFSYIPVNVNTVEGHRLNFLSPNGTVSEDDGYTLAMELTIWPYLKSAYPF